jgi:hypothetical protein
LSDADIEQDTKAHTTFDYRFQKLGKISMTPLLTKLELHDPQIIRGRTSSGPYLVWQLLALATIAAGPKSP